MPENPSNLFIKCMNHRWQRERITSIQFTDATLNVFVRGAEGYQMGVIMPNVAEYEAFKAYVDSLEF